MALIRHFSLHEPRAWAEVDEVIGRIVFAEDFVGYAVGVGCCYVGEMGGGSCVSGKVKEVEIFFSSPLVSLETGRERGDALHMLSIMTRKFSCMSVML